MSDGIQSGFRVNLVHLHCKGVCQSRLVQLAAASAI
jgi:hypothetical protein